MNFNESLQGLSLPELKTLLYNNVDDKKKVETILEHIRNVFSIAEHDNCIDRPELEKYRLFKAKKPAVHPCCVCKAESTMEHQGQQYCDAHYRQVCPNEGGNEVIGHISHYEMEDREVNHDTMTDMKLVRNNHRYQRGAFRNADDVNK